MRIIISGGTGLIGSKLVDSLAAEQHEVLVLSRSPEKYTFPPGVTGVKWNGRTAEGWGHLVNETDAIINLAGENIAGTGFIPSRWTPERKQRIHDSRLQAGKAVVEAFKAATNKPSVLIQSSAVDYYGPRGDEIITEEAAPGSSFLSHVCQDWEQATQAVEALGVRRAIIRTGVVLSMEGGALPITVLPYRLFVGGPLGNGRQWWPWIHIDDEVRAIRFLLENEAANGVFNLTAPNPLTNRAFSKVIGQVLKRPSFIPVPTFALKLALGEVSTLVLDGQRAVPQRLEAAGFIFRFPDAKSALTDLLR
jgi:uncharacterized protein (TIGR01777 family)